MDWKGEAKDERDREAAKVRARSRRAEEAEERQRAKELGEMAPVEDEEPVAEEEMDGVEDLVEVVMEVEEPAVAEKGTKRKRPSLGGEAAGQVSAAAGIKRKKS